MRMRILDFWDYRIWFILLLSIYLKIDMLLKILSKTK